jgi:hypothetical protein
MMLDEEQATSKIFPCPQCPKCNRIQFDLE